MRYSFISLRLLLLF